MKGYITDTVTRFQEGASMEDMLSGDAYETAYLVYSSDGELMWDTTNYDLVKKYFENDSIEPEEYEGDYEYIPHACSGDYSPSNPWDAPGMSIHDFI